MELTADTLAEVLRSPENFHVPVDLCAEIATQDGLLHRRQLYALGMSRAKLRWEITRGTWRMILPAVYATFTGALSQRQLLIAACLYAGDDAQVTGSAAVRAYGLRRVPADDGVRVLVPHSRQVEPAGWVRPQRTRHLDPRPNRLGRLILASLPRAVLDTVRRCDAEGPARALLSEAVETRHCSIADLRAELATGRRQHSAGVRRLLIELASRGTRHPTEAIRDRLAGSPILPTVLWEPLLHTADGQPLQAPDGWIAEVDLGIELEPVGRHITLDGWARTLHRHAELTRQGAAILRFTMAQLAGDPGDIQRLVEEVYLDRLRRGIHSTLTATPRGFQG